ncbi:MAG: hypothetical protein E7388_06925 [Ruminococcaceae bacterium]|nr:hypothetical protein [Oscillospiraceae bacterium]
MILKNFKPYNHLDYFDCYYKAMFHIMDYFGIDVYRFLLNQLYVYKYCDEGKYSFSLFQYSLQQDTLEYTGLVREKVLINDNPILQINQKIESSKPVMFLMDCFYIPFRIDTYNSVHTSHFICIYGFNNKRNIFNIIDHDYVNSFAYREHELSYDALLDYINAYKKNNLYFYAFSKDESIDQSDKSYIQEYSNVVLRNKNLLNDGIRRLYDFIDFFTSELQSSTANEFVEKIMIVIVNITRSVKQREDLLKAYILDSQLIMFLEAISQKWTVIRSLLFKFVRYEQDKKLSLIPNVCNYIKEVFEMESEFNKKLINYCKG